MHDMLHRRRVILHIAMVQVSSLVINPFTNMSIHYNEFYIYVHQQDAMHCVVIFVVKFAIMSLTN